MIKNYDDYRGDVNASFLEDVKMLETMIELLKMQVQECHGEMSIVKAAIANNIENSQNVNQHRNGEINADIKGNRIILHFCLK